MDWSATRLTMWPWSTQSCSLLEESSLLAASYLWMKCLSGVASFSCSWLWQCWGTPSVRNSGRTLSSIASTNSMRLCSTCSVCLCYATVTGLHLLCDTHSAMCSSMYSWCSRFSMSWSWFTVVQDFCACSYARLSISVSAVTWTERLPRSHHTFRSSLITRRCISERTFPNPNLTMQMTAKTSISCKQEKNTWI